MLLDFQTNADNENNLYLQVAKEYSIKADNKNKEFESYSVHGYQTEPKMRLIFKHYRRFFSLCVNLNIYFQQSL